MLADLPSTTIKDYQTFLGLFSARIAKRTICHRIEVKTYKLDSDARRSYGKRRKLYQQWEGKQVD